MNKAPITRSESLITEYRRVQLAHPSRWEGLMMPDKALLIVIALLLCFGLVMMASASVDVAYRHGNSIYYYFYRQLVFLVLSLMLAYTVFSVPATNFEGRGKYFIWFSVLFLLLVFSPLGTKVGGASRWIDFKVFSFQVSEFVKFSVLLFFSDFIIRNEADLHDRPWFFLGTLAVPLGLLIALLMKQPDFGSSVLIVMTVFLLLTIAELPKKILVKLLAGALILGLIAILFKSYRLNRILAFLDPFSDPYGVGYQLVHSLIAVASHGWQGRGLGESVQKYEFLPEAHNDFIFAVISEELGLRGGLFVLICFLILFWRCLKIGERAVRIRRLGQAYYVWGVGILLFLQAGVHISVNIGLFPTKGLTLPLISYGGTSLLVTCAMLALVLRIDAECREQAKREGKL